MGCTNQDGERNSEKNHNMDTEDPKLFIVPVRSSATLVHYFLDSWIILITPEEPQFAVCEGRRSCPVRSTSSRALPRLPQYAGRARWSGEFEA